MGSTPADSESFCLKWNEYESNIKIAFGDLRRQSDFFDVTLFTKDGSVLAHKVILSACSDFFRETFKRMQPRTNLTGHPMAIFLRGVSQHQLQSILEFMYQGEVNVTNNNLTEFLAVAEELQVKGLTNKEEPPVVPPSPTESKPVKNIAPKHFPGPSNSNQASGGLVKRSLPPSALSNIPNKKVKSEEVVLLDHTEEEPSYSVDQQSIKSDPEIIIEDSGPAEVNEDFDGYQDYYEEDEEVGEESVSNETGQAFVRFGHLQDIGGGKTQCNLCFKEFASRTSAIHHTSRAHEASDLIECKICKKVVKNKMNFRNHILLAHQIRGRNIVESYGIIVQSQ